MDILVGDSLIEQQIRRWELARQQREQVVRPCVAMSRFPGTPGAELGRNVAERLGYGFFGIELVDEIVRTEGVSRYLVEQLDEHVRTGLDRWLLDTFHHPAWTEKEYLYDVARTISALAHKGSAVILGRGAPFLLSDEQAFKVQVIASRGTRARRLAAAKGVDGTHAASMLQAEENDRLRFLREFVADPDDPLHFDVVVNTDHRDIAYWTDLIVGAVDSLPPLEVHD
jgi:cytidylate kinase